MGKEMLALDVFSMSIQFLKADMMSVVRKGTTSDIEEDDIHWVLTVPAIWSDAAKQFMREAAEKAGIKKENLTLSLEPEAASVYCRQIPISIEIDKTNQTIAELPVGTKYLVVDAGGGTIDITAHEVQASNTLREIHAATGGGWGGRMVDEAFQKFLVDLVGNDVYEEFKATETEDWLDLFREFESRKRDTSADTEEDEVTIRVPSSLLYKEKNGKTIREYIRTSQYAVSVNIIGDKIRISRDLFNSFFSESVRNMVSHLRSIDLTNMNTIVMVGGYSESQILQKGVKETFPDKQIVVPQGASSVVLRGALIFGHKPEIITERILKYTFGVSTAVLFDFEKHPIEKLVKYNEGDYCVDMFYVLAEVGQTVKTNESQFTNFFFTICKKQNSMTFKIYATKDPNPEYVDDDGCTQIGELEIEFDEPQEEDRTVNLTVMFGGTEIFVEAEDKKTGKKTRTTVNFLGFSSGNSRF